MNNVVLRKKSMLDIKFFKFIKVTTDTLLVNFKKHKLNFNYLSDVVHFKNAKVR